MPRLRNINHVMPKSEAVKKTAKQTLLRIVRLVVWLGLLVAIAYPLATSLLRRTANEWRPYMLRSAKLVCEGGAFDEAMEAQTNAFSDTIHRTQLRLITTALIEAPDIPLETFCAEAGMPDAFVLDDTGVPYEMYSDKLDANEVAPYLERIVALHEGEDEFTHRFWLAQSEKYVTFAFLHPIGGHYVACVTEITDGTPDGARFTGAIDSMQSDDEFDIAINMNSGAVLYLGGLHEPDLTIDEIGLSREVLEDGHIENFKYNGEDYFGAVSISDNGLCVVHVVREMYIFRERLTLLELMLTLLLALCALLWIYTQLITRANRRSGVPHDIRRFRRLGVDVTLASQLVKIVVVGLVLIPTCALFFQDLMDTSDAVIGTLDTLTIMDDSYKKSQNTYNNARAALEDVCLSETRTIGWILLNGMNAGDNMQDPTYLNELSQISDAEYIMIFNKYGKLVATDSGYSALSIDGSVPDDPASAFAPLLKGVEPILADSFMGEKDIMYAGMTMRDISGRPNGAVICAFNFERDLSPTMPIETAFDRTMTYSGKTDRIAVIDHADGKINYTNVSEWKGLPASRFSLKEEDYLKSFRGMLKSGQDKYIACSNVFDGRTAYVLVKPDLSGNLTTTVQFAITLGAMLLLAAAFALVRICGKDAARTDAQNRRPADIKTGYAVDLYRELCDSATHGVGLSDALNTTFAGRKPSEQFDVVLRFAFAIYTLFTMMMLTLNSGLSVLNEGGHWADSINVFSIANCTALVITVATVVMVLQALCKFMARISDPRMATLYRLMRSGVVYIAAILCLLRCLKMVGVDTKSIVKSMGIMGIVVGLGAQKFIGDLIAGIFTIFEGYVNVGDIVAINAANTVRGGARDYATRGVVKEIGLRNMQIVTEGNDIIVMSNSSIQNIINLSLFTSTVTLKILVAHDDNVIRTLTHALRDLEKEHRIEIATLGPSLEIVDVTDNGLIVAISLGCDERHREQAQKVLKFKLIKLLEANEIEYKWC